VGVLLDVGMSVQRVNKVFIGYFGYLLRLPLVFYKGNVPSLSRL